MDALRATAALAAPIASAASTATTTPVSTPAATTDAAKSFDTLLTEAKKDLKSGEKLTKVDGHEFARIKGGERDDMCVNLSGNGRNGQAFDLISRGGRQFHVYGGAGADHVVVEVGKKAAATTDAAATTGATTTTATTTTGAATSGTTGGTTTTQS
ncbi:MAG: hypothetical protein QOH30_4056 [Baekduia sp.]|jgi:hypothetical protein|nr:hypothetical protein [Baekduia sp.]